MLNRFMQKVSVPSDANLCWNWTGSTIKGYGQFWKDGTNVLAHRVSYEIHHGVKPLLSVLHSCDNPLCVNPAHLREGTSVDNMQDRLVRGRNPNAVKTHCKKGHEYTPDNTYVYNNMRSCKKCKAISFNNFKERQREHRSN